MSIISILVVIFGLSLFEAISSIDNAVINADVLANMQPKARQWFLSWGLVFAVFVVRGFLPWLIVWLTNPELGFIGSFTATFSSNPQILKAIELSSPILLMAGGTFLVFIFFNWLFLEEKKFGLSGERFIYSQGIWFYAVVSVLLAIIVWYGLKINPLIGFGSVVGSTAFFITHGFKQNAEKAEKELLQKNNLTDLSKILYLEVIDATFSIDGVLGAFAFTLAVPLIIIGNGFGAFIVRQLTVKNVEKIKKYVYLKNGAMYSILFLGGIMILGSLGLKVPEWLSPLITFLTVGYFFWKSKIYLKNNATI